MYHLLTGHNPSEPPYEMYPITYWDPTLSTGLESIVWQCTQQNPNDRFSSCEELLFAFEHYREYDLSYKKQQNKKIFLFASCLAMSIICGVSAMVAGAQYKKTLTSNYEYYIQCAQSEVQKEDIIKQYQNAVNVEPSKGEAYELLLDNVILEDDILTEDEAYAIRDILNGKAGRNQTNEELFSTNAEAYENFAYKLGIAYFYTYEDRGNKSLAKKWLEIAAHSVKLDVSKVKRAECLGRIAGYYSKIGVNSKSGDKSISYTDYWNDLVFLMKGNLAKRDNATTALIMYQEMAYQIYTNGIHFMSEGITQEELKAQLVQIEEQMKNDTITLECKTNQRIKKLYNQLEGYVNLAYENIDVTLETMKQEDE